MVLCWPVSLRSGPGAGGGSSDFHCRSLQVTDSEAACAVENMELHSQLT